MTEKRKPFDIATHREGLRYDHWNPITNDSTVYDIHMIAADVAREAARKHCPTPVTPRSWHETRPGAHDRSVSHVEWATASADGLTDLAVRRTPVEMLQPVNFAIYLVGLAAVVVIAIVIGCEINAVANGYPRPMLQLWSALLGECSL